MSYIFSINYSTIKLSSKDNLIEEINKFDIRDIKAFIHEHGNKIKEEEKERLEILLSTLLELEKNGVKLKDLFLLIILIKADLFDLRYFKIHNNENALNKYLNYLNKTLQDIQNYLKNIPDNQYQNIDKIENLFGNPKFRSFKYELENKINYINNSLVRLEMLSLSPSKPSPAKSLSPSISLSDATITLLSPTLKKGGSRQKQQNKKIKVRLLKKYTKNI